MPLRKLMPTAKQCERGLHLASLLARPSSTTNCHSTSLNLNWLRSTIACVNAERYRLLHESFPCSMQTFQKFYDCTWRHWEAIPRHSLRNFAARYTVRSCPDSLEFLLVDDRVVGFILGHRVSREIVHVDANVVAPEVRGSWANVWLKLEATQEAMQWGIKKFVFTSFDHYKDTRSFTDKNAWCHCAEVGTDVPSPRAISCKCRRRRMISFPRSMHASACGRSRSNSR